jgi:GMP synthase (glutamine-hydrolysing)
MPKRKTKAPVLIVLHQEHSTPGRVGRLLIERGHRLDIRRPRFGDPLPATLIEHAGAVIFGGPMSANDPNDFIKAEIDWIGVPLKENRPFLGLCLGAQMLAKHMGANVWQHPQGRAEIGYYPLLPTEAGMRLGEAWDMPWPTHVYHWHR